LPEAANGGGRFSREPELGGLLPAGGQAGFGALDPLFFGGATAPEMGLHRRYNCRRFGCLAVRSGRRSIRGPIVIGASLGSN
jgi:hypothetical protein